MRRWSSRLPGGVQWNERAHDLLATGAHNLRLIPLVSPQLKCTPLSLSTVILDIYLSFSFHLSIRLLLVFWGLPTHFFFHPSLSHRRSLSLWWRLLHDGRSFQLLSNRRSPSLCLETRINSTSHLRRLSSRHPFFFILAVAAAGWPGGPAAAVACGGYFNLLPPILD